MPVYGLGIISVLYGLAIVLEIFLICRPLAAVWDSSITGTCGQELVSYLILEISGLFIDLGILIIPLRGVWSLELPWKRKVGIACIFAISALYVPVRFL